MKTKTLWIDFITHGKKRTWKWKPWFLKSQIIYGRGGKTWLAPHWELGWGCLVFHWTGYDCEKEYTGSYKEDHECPAELMQERINELEHAIRKHRRRMAGFPLSAQDMLIDNHDIDLWKVLGDGS